MNLNKHSALDGRHAFLSPSNYHWLNYDDQRLEARYFAASSARRGTDLHLLAHEAIRLRVYLDESNNALANYVYDAIELGMTCEQPLYYSDNCFGTADTLLFRDNFLRIHDLKTGITHASEKQLEVYAALFCLEYGVSPFEIDIELRIYQGDEVRCYGPIREGLLAIMDKIIEFDLKIEAIKEANR